MHSARRRQGRGLGAIVADVLGDSLLAGVRLLRRRPPETFAILTRFRRSWQPVAGWLILGQHLAVTGYVAIVLVTAAGIGGGAAPVAGRTWPRATLGHESPLPRR